MALGHIRSKQTTSGGCAYTVMPPRKRCIRIIAAVAVLGITLDLTLLRLLSFRSTVQNQYLQAVITEPPPPSTLEPFSTNTSQHAAGFPRTNHTVARREILNASLVTDDEEDDGDDMDPFAKQEPKGDRWSSPWKSHDNFGRWWRYSDSCIEIERVCRSEENKWFYYGAHTEEPNQPTIELKYVPYSYRRGVYADTRARMKVRSSSRVEAGHLKGRCSLSDVETHVVLHSQFDDMIGEFYARSLTNLFEIQNTRRYNSSASDAAEETQYYVHIPYENKAKLLDAHKLFLSGLQRQHNASRPIRWAKEAVDLLRPESDSNCECFKRVVFCGYSIYQQTEHQSTIDEKNRREHNYTLWPGKYIDSFGVDLSSMSSCRGKSDNPYACDAYSRLRYALFHNIGSQYHDIDRLIRNRRREVLASQNLIRGNYTGDTSEWTFVGLAQRSSRRSWINMPSVMNACRKEFAGSRVVLVEVNVEYTSTPSEQFLLHRSLDAMVGVHGAQMTQGILLPPGSHILELLPWVPSYARGDWVTWTSSPTPLGIVFHNTDLNHFGYKLGRCSVPLCEGVPEEKEQECFEKEGKRGW